MASNPTDPIPPKPGGLWARLRNALGADRMPEEASASPAAKDADLLPTFDVPLPTTHDAIVVLEEAAEYPIAEPLPMEGSLDAAAEASPIEPVTVEDAASQVEYCPACAAQRPGQSQFCYDCGYMYPPPGQSPATPSEHAAAVSTDTLLAGRYRLLEPIARRGSIERFRASDHGHADGPTPVVLVRAPRIEPVAPERSPFEIDGDLEVNIGFLSTVDEVPLAKLNADIDGLSPEWPSLGWEWRLLNRVTHSAWPKVQNHFVEGGFDYLVENAPVGRPFWDAWEDASVDHRQRFAWLAEIAEALKALHNAGAFCESVRPDLLALSADGMPVFTEARDLLPLPMPAELEVQAGVYTAPELILERESVDARADLYGFGAMLYALYLGRELTEMDFERQGVPKAFVLRFPDVHPALARVMMKTFVREREQRFPSEEAAREDPTGFTELARVLRVTGRLMTQVRLDVAGWTTTGMIRTNNEDAFALIQSVGSKQDDFGERLVAILADGMGGYEAGEIAAALAIDQIRQQLLREPTFAGLAGDASREETGFHAKACRDFFANVLRETNRAIFQASRAPGGKRGMGCTAEIVFLTGGRLVVGHVGDSRVYHYSGGRLTQLTRDQTLVGRLVELGQLTEQEAEDHPRKNELQQALGGQPTVDPLTYDAVIQPGEWVLVCSDGLTGHVNHATLTEMVQRADSAEMLARRLCNLANLYGGTDNCTVIAIRAS